MRKQCRVCLKKLPLSQFCKDKNRKDGHFTDCKKCSLKRRMAYYRKNKALEQKKNREYNYAHRKEKNEANKRWVAKNPEKFRAMVYKRLAKSVFERKARGLLNYHVSIGKILKQACCICGKKKAEAHHSDYSKPFDVIWMCKLHHAEWHRTNLTEQEKHAKKEN